MDTIEQKRIVDESTADQRRFQFYIGNCRRGLVTQEPNGDVYVHWQTAGPSRLDEAAVWFEGLSELMETAQQLKAGSMVKRTRRRKPVQAPVDNGEYKSAAAMYRALILDGLDDAEVYARVKAKFNVDKDHAKWYRSNLKKKGLL